MFPRVIVDLLPPQNGGG